MRDRTVDKLTPEKHAAVKARGRSYKQARRELGLCADCANAAEYPKSRCEECGQKHRHRERLAAKYGRPEYRAHLYESLALWERALLARGQLRKANGHYVSPFREKKAS